VPNSSARNWRRPPRSTRSPAKSRYINCEVTDTQYRVLAQLANKFIEKNEAVIDDRVAELEGLRERAREDETELDDTEFDSVDAVTEEIDDLESDREGFEEVPMTGWPTDRVYSSFFDAVDYHERVVVIMLDEIDKLVEKSGDDTLYNLSRMNSQLENSRVSIMGISNDLKFTDFLDPASSPASARRIVFPRPTTPTSSVTSSTTARTSPSRTTRCQTTSSRCVPRSPPRNTVTPGVPSTCCGPRANSPSETRQTSSKEAHVRKAQEKIELDRVVEVVRTLPTQSKIVLFAIMLLEKNGVRNINTGEVYNIYKRLCEEIDADILTQRRVTDLISELDMLGIVNAVVVSKGRYGRTKEISLSVPTRRDGGRVALGLPPGRHRRRRTVRPGPIRQLILSVVCPYRGST